jgi:hypothetical protein
MMMEVGPGSLSSGTFNQNENRNWHGDKHHVSDDIEDT